MQEYAILRKKRFVSKQHRFTGAVPDGWCLRSYIGPVPGDCIAILSPPDAQLPDISVRNVKGTFSDLDELAGTTRHMIAVRQCEILSNDEDLTLDGLPARRIHYRDGNLHICKVFVLREHLGYSVIASDEKPLDLEFFADFVQKIDWRFDPRSLPKSFGEALHEMASDPDNIKWGPQQIAVLVVAILVALLAFLLYRWMR